jgi:hypothetical protein
VSPVRVLGRSNPVAYTRGGRTFGGSLIFASFGKDVFADLYRPDIIESFVDSSTSMFVDQLPPFTIVVTASNELGGISQQIISGITLINYGAVYSIDDVYTEVSYTFVATDVTPLLLSPALRGIPYRPAFKTPHRLSTSQDLDAIKRVSDRQGYAIREQDAANLDSTAGLIKDQYYWTRDNGHNTLRQSASRNSLLGILG